MVWWIHSCTESSEQRKPEEVLFLDRTRCVFSEVDHINAQHCPRHGDECSLLPLVSGWDWSRFHGVTAVNACQAASTQRFPWLPAASRRLTNAGRRLEEWLWGGVDEGNYMGTSVWVVWWWGWGGGGGGVNDVVAALPLLMSCFLFPPLCGAEDLLILLLLSPFVYWFSNWSVCHIHVLYVLICPCVCVEPCSTQWISN